MYTNDPALLEIIDELIFSEDNTGCDSGLTVVSLEAFNKLAKYMAGEGEER